MSINGDVVRDGTQTDDQDELVGRVLSDRYAVQKVIGRGGMSVVYLARDARLDRDVAVKVFSGLSLREEARKLSYEHFVQEAFALSELKHPNTLRIFDFAYLDDAPPHVPFQVSEYMDGGTLHDLIKRRGTLSTQNTIGILHALGGALAEAHSCGIVHRDVKPTNILFAKAGKQRIVKLADFSVAFALRSGTREQRARPAFYSLGWSAPEQMRRAVVTPTADIYGLGLLMAFMLSGEAPRPYPSETDFMRDPHELDGLLKDAIAKLELPSRFADVCFKACRAQPELRYRSVDSFLGAVREARIAKPTTREQAPWSDVSNIPTHPEPSEDSLIVLQSLDKEDVVAGGRRIKVVDLDGDSAIGDDRARIRVTAMTDLSVHVRSLNCFLSRAGGRLTTGVDLAATENIALFGTDRKPAGQARVTFGEKSPTSWIFKLGAVRIVVPASACLNAFFVELEEKLYLFCQK